MKSSARVTLLGEIIGTFLLVFFGCGSVAAAVLTGAQVGVFQVAIVWGLGVAIAIFVTGALSGAHLNPAVTLALVTARRFPIRLVPAYFVAQSLGAFAAAAAIQITFASPLSAFEAAHRIVRGAPGSEASAMIFGEYFPNPGGRPLTVASYAVSPASAFFVEMVGTAVLVIVILSLTHHDNGARPRGFAPLMIGLTLTALISLLAPLTQAGFNPARDLLPRLWSALAGWRSVPFTANGGGWFWVYIVGPLTGGQLAAIFYRRVLRGAYSAPSM